jgi:uncharacterized protein YfaS (alpha-2-macroglobulin family)
MLRALSVGVLLFAVTGMVGMALFAAQAEKPTREDLAQMVKDGNYADAYQGYRRLALDPQTDPRQVGDDLTAGVQCLRNLGRLDEIDEFLESTIAVHAQNWRLLTEAAENYLSIDPYGHIIAGKFYRGNNRGGDRLVNTFARDRVRALQLLQQALPLVRLEENHGEAAQFYLSLGRALLSNRGYTEAWRLQYLTDLATLPDYDDGWYYGSNERGAPVNADGTPVYHTTPESWEAAASDGQRWRWSLVQAQEMDASLRNNVRWTFAEFLHNQFGVQTLATYGFWFGGGDHDDDDAKTSTYALHTLTDEETLARLANGVKRFTLPDEFNYIKLYRQIAADADTGYGAQALEALAGIHENRRQYPRAAEYWRQCIQKHGAGNNNYRQQRLDQIVGNWGRFEGTTMQPAGTGATVDFRFRNGKSVHFEAREVLIDRLLADVKAYLKTRPAELDWQKVNIQDLSYRFMQEGHDKYLGKSVATWDLPLEPRADHFDRRITVSTPLQKAGGYLLTAKMADGNETRQVVWLADTTIVKKPLVGKTLYYVADAVTGQPIAKANVEFFGYRQRYDGNRYHVDTLNFAEFSDADGLVQAQVKENNSDFQWLVVARTDKGRMAHLGFTGMWRGQYYDQQYEATKVFTITDRPVYRPLQTVKFKFWVRHAQYDQEDVSDFAKQSFRVEIHDPQGNKVLEQSYQSDEYGGIEGEYNLPDEAPLGMYQVFVVDHGGGSFRVEEYKKPEFEVKIDAPTEPVMLGEKITAKITARYLFGAPVVEARVKYKVYRDTYNERWYPVGAWDWFYGPGYWWFGYDYPWYPGWQRWGCARPIASWWGYSPEPPELVAEVEAPIGADGTVAVEIDTALAKEIHPDHDHNYRIEAEVVDASRRTIVGSGSVLVAREPFKVFAWLDRGYYREGDTIEASFSAHTLDQRPVKGTGKLTLFKVSYDDQGQPVEDPVETWDLDTDDQGRARQQIAAATGGQYRLSYTLTDAAGHAIEGGYLFTIRGQGLRTADFQFNDIELIPDKREYAPGEKVKLQVNINRAGGTVLLFLRPANGVYLPPQLLRLRGKSTVVEFDVSKKDMPNFFIEAVTVADGRLHSELKEIVVPPEKRVLNVALEPSSAEYKPGQEAEVKLTLTDFFGKPFVGSTVLTIYDKAVEYVSGGSNVPEIKEFFWKWRRSHYPQNESNLLMSFYNLVPGGQVGMNDLGVFGGTVADELRDGEMFAFREQRGVKRKSGRGGADRNMMLGEAAAMDALSAAPAAPGAGGGFGGGAAYATAEGLVAPQGPGGPEGGPAPLVDPTVRTNFADTALWAGSLTTDGDGVATVKLTMPESLTTWKVRAWGLGHGTKVGQGDVEVITKKNLLLRLQAPRFFVEKDEVVLSANVHNYLATAKQVQVALELEGSTLEPMDDAVRTVEVAAGGELRVDWRVKVTAEGQAVIRMKALTDEESDAVQMSFPVFVHGMLKQESFAGAIRPNQESGSITIRVPDERRINESRIEVRYSPTLAGAMVDALPYLVDYPYGCTEQTLSRFLPTVITQRILLDMGLDLKAIQQKRTNLNAQEIGDDQKRAEGWKRYDRNPVFDEAEVAAMVKEGVRRLTDMQNGDGGWGWFSGWGEQSYPHTTAYVVHGLQIATQNDVALVPGTLDRGVAWLQAYQDEQVRLLKNGETETKPYKKQADNLDAFVYMVLVDGGVTNDAMRDFLYRDRTHLAVYSKAMFGLALHQQGDAERLAMIQRNIAQFLEQDDENQTAWLRLPEDNYWWHWYGSDIEAMSYYLKLLARTDAQGEVAPRLVKYLLNNRKHATYWNSTRDTAVAIEALAEYLKASGEDRPDMTVEVWLDGQKRKEVTITPADLFTFDNKFELVGDAVESGEHTIELRRRGTGAVYYNAYLTNFTLEDPIQAAGLEIKVQRKFYKLVPVEKTIKVAGALGQAVDQRVEKYDRQEIPDLGVLKSGDLVEVELEIDSKNDYEYLVFEDMKAAGFEPVEVRSGYNGNDLGAYVEFRDERVAFFARTLPRGKHSVSYRLRAEIPGKFSALPARGYAMYAPELKANSDEMKVGIED